ncbi:hypothetical protein MSG28_002132 [Choristoneura fumiferana]|uniref:Uncharacterized protein n=1 Tax=Choristoneura fumiferana TaxID=7141 RepID=A0ACC0JUJ8_CHOFU|nr:hypothetical protein MSG28_002132 [Choristoneura fumiferana]
MDANRMSIIAIHWPAKARQNRRGGRKCGSGEKLRNARGERKRRGVIRRLAGEVKGCRVRGTGVRDGAGRGVRAQRQPPRLVTRLPSVARRLRLRLCDSRRSVHCTRAPITTRAAPLWPRTRPLRYRRYISPNLSATCYVLITFGHSHFPIRLVYPFIVEPRTAPSCSLNAEPLISLFSRLTVACPDRSGRRNARTPSTARPLLNSTVNIDTNACDNNLILA